MVTTKSGATYHANGVCSCRAYENGQPCNHRALARLLTLYHETRGAGAPRITRTVGARVRDIYNRQAKERQKGGKGGKLLPEFQFRGTPRKTAKEKAMATIFLLFSLILTALEDDEGAAKTLREKLEGP
jgi:hypothetical protein